jgi:type VI secretion system secreted protein Hcp
VGGRIPAQSVDMAPSRPEKGPGTMPFDAFLSFTGPPDPPKGETTDAKFLNQIAVKSYSYNVSNNSTVSSDKPGSGAGKAAISGVNIQKNYDNSSPDLFQACCLGTHFASAQINVRKAGEGQDPYIIIDLSEAFISSYSCNGSEGAETPFEAIELTGKTIKLTYIPQKATGGAGVANIKGYDMSQNKKI